MRSYSLIGAEVKSSWIFSAINSKKHAFDGMLILPEKNVGIHDSDQWIWRLLYEKFDRVTSTNFVQIYSEIWITETWCGEADTKWTIEKDQI